MKLHRNLGVTQISVCMMPQKIREGWLDGTGRPLSRKIEVDEVYIGASERNKHESKKLKSGRGERSANLRLPVRKTAPASESKQKWLTAQTS